MYTEIKYVEYTENVLGKTTTFKKKVTVKVSHETKTAEVLFMLHAVLSEHKCAQVPT
jgi:hypothetical protein